MKAEIRKKIAFYTESPSTGGVSAVLEEIVFAASQQCDCVIVCPENQAWRGWKEKFQGKNVIVAHDALRNNADLFGWFELPRLLRIRGTFNDADVIHFHLHTTFSCLPAIFVARSIKRPLSVATEHYVAQIRFLRNRRLQFPLSLLRELLIALKLKLKRLSLPSLDQIVTVSDANHRFFLSTFGQRYANKTISIFNGVDVKSFQGGAPEHDEASIITTIAGLNNQKGHEYLIRAIPYVKRECPRAKFVFAGDGHLRTYLEEIAHSEGVADVLIFAGRIDDVRSLLARSSLVVLPSLFEGMPMSVIEAMAAGKAVVATDVDGTSELVDHGVTGFLVPPKDPRALADKIIALLKNHEQRESLGRNGYERARLQFSVEQMTGKYLNLFEQLLNSATSIRSSA